MADSEKLTKFKAMLRELNALIKDFGWGAQITEDYADSMDQPWLDLSEEERDVLKKDLDVGDYFDENAE